LERREFITSGIFLALGIAVVIGAYRLALGDFHKPGPGLYPFILGLALCGCSIPGVMGALRRANETREEGQEFFKKGRLQKVVFVIIYLTLYGLLLSSMGYVLTTLVIFFLIFKTMGSIKLRTVFIVLILMVGISYYVFAVLLEVPLPVGILGIGI
jgi:putative tricarboxylic transport membrane protein